MYKRHQFNFGEIRYELINNQFQVKEIHDSLQDLANNYQGSVANLSRLIGYTFKDYLNTNSVYTTLMDVKKISASRLIKSLSDPNLNIQDNNIYCILWFSFPLGQAVDFMITVKEYKGLVPQPNIVFYTWNFERLVK